MHALQIAESSDTCTEDRLENNEDAADRVAWKNDKCMEREAHSLVGGWENNASILIENIVFTALCGAASFPSPKQLTHQSQDTSRDLLNK